MDINKFDKMGIPMVLDTPSATIEGQVYKIGFTGLVFVQRNGEWCRTDNHSPGDVRNYIELERLRQISKRKIEQGPQKELTPYMIKKIKAEARRKA